MIAWCKSARVRQVQSRIVRYGFLAHPTSRVAGDARADATAAGVPTASGSRGCPSAPAVAAIRTVLTRVKIAAVHAS